MCNLMIKNKNLNPDFGHLMSYLSALLSHTKMLKGLVNVSHRAALSGTRITDLAGQL